MILFVASQEFRPENPSTKQNTRKTFSVFQIMAYDASVNDFLNNEEQVANYCLNEYFRMKWSRISLMLWRQNMNYSLSYHKICLWARNRIFLKAWKLRQIFESTNKNFPGRTVQREDRKVNVSVMKNHLKSYKI